LSGTAPAQHEGHEPASTPAVANPDPMAAMKDMEPTDHWMAMLHGYSFLNVNRQGGPSGDRDFESQNHLMAMAIRRAWGGRLSLLGTFALEPATIPVAGSPELFQRGETYQGVLLIDLQHPHDLFVQLGAAWEKALSPGAGIRLYLAPLGEPALGPVAYPHRLSASENPTAPLAHHNQDSTHIASDVVTLGFSSNLLTLEASGFHGQEPNENRWDIQQGRLDSYSGRLTVRPLAGLSFQVSSGHLEHPEAAEPGNQTRTTASVTYQKATPGGFLAATLITGRNQTEDGPEWGSTLEWTWKFQDRNFLYGRVERVDRDLYELTYKRQRPEGVPASRTHVEAGTLGYVRNFDLLPPAETGLGGDLTLYGFTSALDAVYGSHPLSFHVFLRIRFGTHTEGHGAAPEHAHGGS
ncbi:MAG: hypothetical protein ACRD1P_11940, partial [Thermoanaerobaculia bacterium]